MKKLRLKMLDRAKPEIYAHFMKSDKTNRLGVAVEHGAPDYQTLYAWMTVKQAESIHRWLTKYLKERAKAAKRTRSKTTRGTT